MVVHVLVTDGEQRAALAAVRSLAGVGYRVSVTSSRRHCLAGASRFAAMHVPVPSPSEAPARYASAIASLVRQFGVEMVLPITDSSLLSLLPARAEIGAPIPFPALDQVRAIGDKHRVLEAAARSGLAVPRQWTLRARGDATPSDLAFPVVIKPHRSVVSTPDGGRQQQVRVAYADDGAALRERLSALPAEAFPVLLQERVRGPGIGVFVLRWNGRVVAQFSHRRLREKPPSGGVSVYRESVAMDPELLARTERLLQAFDWNGVAMVEYKVDGRTGTPYVMEINGRLWGSLQLAIDAGVNFPALLVDAAAGRLPLTPPPYRTGVRSWWFWGDVDQLLTRLRRSRAALSLSAESPGRWRGLRDFAAACLHPGDEEIWRWSDPRPFLRETVDWLGAS